MRCSLFLIISALGLAACSDSTLPPVQTVDGNWKGTQNGFALSLAMAQTGTTVSTCSASFGSTGGFESGTCSGTFVYPTLTVTINVTGFQPLQYVATMSSTEATLSGTLNGSGLDHVAMSVKKQ
jgi:hypothetical protein